MNFYPTGNDFILIDNRNNLFQKDNTHLVEQLCHRHFGVGADGLMLLELAEGYDFRMIYFNSDGNQSSMCGNGGRCLIQFANYLGLIKKNCHTLLIFCPEPHTTFIYSDNFYAKVHINKT